jgi:hypothetical protein
VPKIANTELLGQPLDTGKVLATLGRGEELVVIGEEKDGYINVQSATASGWVKMVLVASARMARVYRLNVTFDENVQRCCGR